MVVLDRLSLLLRLYYICGLKMFVDARLGVE